MRRWTGKLIPAIGSIALLASAAMPVAAQDADPSAVDLQTRVDEFVGLLNGGAAVVTIRDGVTEAAAAGIANIDGEPMTVDTPMLVGGATISMLHGLALQLVEEGLLDLEAEVIDYLPDAPVGQGATVRQLLTGRAGIPQLWPEIEASLADEPDRTWTTDEMVDLLDPGLATPASDEYTGGYAGTLVLTQLIEAVTGAEFGTVMRERITGPLGLEATVFPAGDADPPTAVAGGWAAPFGGMDLAYVTDDWESLRSFRPNVSTAADIAAYLSALIDGRIVSPELLAATAFDEDIELIGHGFLRHDELLPAAGPLGTRYFGMGQFEELGVNFVVAVAPTSGDVVVVLANSWALDTTDLARDIVRSWAPDPLATGDVREAEMLARIVVGMACDLGEPTPFDLPPCPVDEATVTWPFEAPLEYTGAFEGSGLMIGDWTFEQGENAFTYTARGVFMGDVEGCGYGTMYFEVPDGAGHWADDGLGAPVYTGGIATVLPGGTLPLAGTIDMTGPQTSYRDGTATVVHTSTYTCDVAP